MRRRRRLSAGLLLIFIPIALVLGIWLTARPGAKGIRLDGMTLFFALGTSGFIAAYTIVDGFGARLSGSASAYAGMLFHLLLAISAHLNARDGGFVPALIALALLATSFLTQNLARRRPSPNIPSFRAHAPA